MHLKLHSNRIDTGAVEIVLVNDTGDPMGGWQSDPDLDFAALQVRPRMERTREAFDRTASSADVCRELIADLLLMASPPVDAPLAGGSRNLGNGFRINQCHRRVDDPHRRQCYPVSPKSPGIWDNIR